MIRRILSKNPRLAIRTRSILLSFAALLALSSCGTTTDLVGPGDLCTGYPAWQISEYILPYQAETAHEVFQGNCAPPNDPWTHYGRAKYAYDFEMPIGTRILASRAGTVIFVREQFTDTDHKQEQGNAVVVLHEDNTVALYGHMTHHGVLVELGQSVEQGDVLALSGNSGQSPVPHLHFQVNACPNFDTCESIPISFRNARPNPGRLLQGVIYEAW